MGSSGRSRKRGYLVQISSQDWARLTLPRARHLRLSNVDAKPNCADLSSHTRITKTFVETPYSSFWNDASTRSWAYSVRRGTSVSYFVPTVLTFFSFLRL